MIQEMSALKKELYWLESPLIFVGGAALHFYLDDFARSQLRTTKDIDIIITKIVTSMDWMTLEQQLQHHKWTPDMNGPICRYTSPLGTTVDFLFSSEDVIGFTNVWYTKIIQEPLMIQMGDESFCIATPVHYLGTKLEAFWNRGQTDPYISHDLEDIVSLVDGCNTLISSFINLSQQDKSHILL